MYVDSHGKRTRSVELQFPSQPLYVASLRTELGERSSLLLLTFSLTHINVFDLHSTQWIQTINLRNTRPMYQHGENYLMCLSCTNDSPTLVQIIPAGDTSMLITAKGDETKPFTMHGSTVAQRIMQSASRAPTEVPRKVRMLLECNLNHNLIDLYSIEFTNSYQWSLRFQPCFSFGPWRRSIWFKNQNY